MERRKIAAGNWKMNGLRSDLSEVAALAAAHSSPMSGVVSEVVICPPATLLAQMASALSEAAIAVGGQDCHRATSGAHTGDISAEMLADAGATYVILGHSERRADHGETDDLVRAKAEAVIAAGLTPIICLGETLAQREAGETLAVVRAQLRGSVPEGADGTRFVMAYEPVWAIGTGKVASLAQIAEVHDDMRLVLGEICGASGAATRILYGGSVKPGNAAEIFGVSNVDGALVGGASLKAADFGAIVAALDAA